MAKTDKNANPEKKVFNARDNALLITHCLQLINLYEFKKRMAKGEGEQDRWKKALEQEKKNLEKLNKVREKGLKMSDYKELDEKDSLKDFVDHIVDRLKEVRIPELEKYATEFSKHYFSSNKEPEINLKDMISGSDWKKSWEVEVDWETKPKIKEKKGIGFPLEYEPEPPKPKIRIINTHTGHKIIEPEFEKYIKEKRIRFTDIFDRNVF